MDSEKVTIQILKTIWFFVLVLAVFGLYVVFGPHTKEAQYCGTVVSIYKTEAGYKVSSERHVVFYNDSLKRNIDVRVTNQQYVNTRVGQRICFDLNEMQLEE